MNASDIVTAVSNNLNRSDITTAQILNWLNDRQKQICNMDNFYFMEKAVTAIPTIASTQSYSISSAVGAYKDELQMWLVSGGNKKILIKWVGSEAEKAYTNPTQSGEPTNYWVWDQKYWLYPIPDAVYTLELKCYVYVDDITNTAAELNDICKYWPDLLINGATSDGFHYLQMPDKYTEWESKASNELAKLMRREGKRRYQNYTPRLRVRIH